MGMMDE